MAIFIGVFIVALVVFMVFAMALAEWADKDPGDLFSAWFGRKQVKAAAPAATASAGSGQDLAAAGAANASSAVTTGTRLAAKRGSRPKAPKVKTATPTKTTPARKKT